MTTSWRARLGSAAVVHEARSAPTVLLVAFCALVCLPMAILLTPDQDVTVAGQRLSVGAREPSLSLSGPAQLVQIGNTEFDVTALQVYGPLRPRLTLGPVQRNTDARGAADLPSAAGTIGNGFLDWYGWATLILLGFTLAASSVVGCIRMVVRLRRLGRDEDQHVGLATLWHRYASQLAGSTAVAVVATMLLWAIVGALAYDGTADGLRRIRSLSDLAGTYHLSPSPVGPEVHGFTGAVIGDSRAARLGGPPITDGTEDDLACGRSTDSLAVELGRLTGTQVRNLACSGASIRTGLRGPQSQGSRTLPPQVGILKQIQDLKHVVVVIGPNDLYWADFLRYCYGVENCQDNLTQGEFGIRLASFDRDYGELLRDINDLPGDPQVVIVASYDVFGPQANCSDTDGPAEVPGLSPADLQLLAGMNRQLNEVLTAGAEKYEFAVATPRLATLCQPAHPGLGRDIQGLEDSHPFHPTAIGTVRMAASVAQLIDPNR